MFEIIISNLRNLCLMIVYLLEGRESEYMFLMLALIAFFSDV